MEKMGKKAIIFDFDGTIADSIPALVKISSGLLQKNGLSPITEEDFFKLKELSSREILEQIRLPKWKLPFIVWKGKKQLEKEIVNIPPIKDIIETLIILKERGYTIAILTSSSEDTVDRFLEKNNLRIFDFICTDSSLFGKHRKLNKLIKKYDLSREDTFYVGDETRDVEAARKSGIKSISVTWGLASENSLKKHQPDYLLNEAGELLNIFK